MNISAYTRDIIPTNFLRKEFPFFDEFYKRYENNIDRIAIIADRGYIDEADYEFFDFYDYEEDNRDEVEQYLSNFSKDFYKVVEKISKKTGAIIDIGYAKDVRGGIDGVYFYVINTFVKNPNIDDDFFKKIDTNRIIIENFDE